MPENYVEMELREIQIVEDLNRTQVLILAEKEGKRIFPIFIGFNEAMALDLAARGEQMPRPMTHDLILNAIDGLRGRLNRVLVVKLESDTFFGALEVQRPTGELVRVDSRPSDAIVLATKRHVPIFVEENVLREVQRGTEETEPDADAEGGPEAI